MSDKCPSCGQTARVLKEGSVVRAQCDCVRSSLESSEAEALSDWYNKAHKPECAEMKYVIVKGEWGEEVPIVFSKSLQHATFCDQRVVSAGFCTIDFSYYKVCCYGKSVSLNLESREKDSLLVRRLFFRDP